jgi:ribosome biogenesis GTPase / thiamine phosphate phosphatase
VSHAEPDEPGRIVRLYSDFATVQKGGEKLETTLRGKLFRENPPAVGDFVRLDGQGDSYAIAEVLPRRNELSRRAAGTVGQKARKQVLIANIDQVIVVFAAAQPDPVLAMLDRFLVVVEANNLDARLVVNKIDLVERHWAEEFFKPYREVGYPVLFTSVRTGEGVSELRESLKGTASVLVGPSGVGKSSLLNTLYPGLDLRVGEISEALGKGRHTTVGGQLIPLPDGAWVADTAGLREVGLWVMPPDELPDCFPEFRPHLDDCRFNDCAHITEPGCAILAALAEGKIDPSRHASYTKLRAEAVEMWPRW